MSLKGRRVLVTGGAGFIGSELIRQLAAEAAEVQVVDNLVNGSLDNIRDVLSSRVQLVRADVRDVPAMARAVENVSVIYHLACLGVRHSIHSPEENHDVNATATLQLLKLANSRNVERFVYVSTSEVYGTARTVPMTEDHPTYPMTVYGAGKLAGEGYARAFHRTYDLPVVVVRPFNAYGPRSHHEGDCGEVIPKFMLRGMVDQPPVIFGDGTQTRDFTYVSDTAHGILLAGIVEGAIGETINLGSGREVTIKDLAAIIAQVLGHPGMDVVHDAPRPGDVLRLCADSTKAHAILGFRPTISLRDGLEALKRWYLQLGAAAHELLEHDVIRNWQGGSALRGPALGGARSSVPAICGAP
jgi:UDP-glucose 4-epimerase